MTLEELRTQLSDYSFFVTYAALPKEAPAGIVLPSDAHAFVVPADRTTDPLQLAHEAAEQAKGRKTAVLLPGTRFDATGTRHGRGGGWYDRFLAATPQEWLRIGVCRADQFSPEPLARQPWDEPIDHVIVLSDTDISRVCETRARSC